MEIVEFTDTSASFLVSYVYFPALSNKILSIISFALFTERYPSSIFLSEHYTVKNGMQEGSHNFPLLSTYHIPSRFYQSGTSQSTDALHVLMQCRIRLGARSDPDTDSDIRLLWKKIIHPWKATMQQHKFRFRIIFYHIVQLQYIRIYDLPHSCMTL